MSALIHPYEVSKETEMLEPLDFNRRSRLKHVDKVFKATITNIIPLTEMEKLFHVRLKEECDRNTFSFLPGQFVMVEVPGYGEIPISISGSASQKGMLQLCIRKAGLVTSALHKATPGAVIGIRGPFGTHFPMEKMKRQHVLLVAGGLGIAPLRAPLAHITENRSDFDQVHLIYGAKNPSQLLFDYQYDQWKRVDNINLQIIVEEPDKKWSGHVGMLTSLVENTPLPMDKTFAIVCGPPVMFKFVCNMLSQMGMPMHRMFVSLERRMHCGMGKCCRCNVGSTYVCLDGPVFDFWSVMNLKEAI